MKRITIGFLSLLAIGFSSAMAANLTVLQEKKPLPTISYSNEAGKKTTLSTKNHKLTALHFWATWCVPCVEELPQVDAAAAKYVDKKFQVIALSLDGKKSDKVKQFFADHKVKTLKPFLDSDMSAFRAAQVSALPTTIFINEKGEEIARIAGPANWEDEELRKFIEGQLK